MVSKDNNYTVGLKPVSRLTDPTLISDVDQDT